MADDNPELVLPVRFDMDKAIKALTKLQQAGEKQSASAVAGHEKMKTATNESTAATSHLAMSAHAMISIFQSAQGVAKSALGVVTDEFRRSSNHCREIAKDFADLRRSMQEVATVTGGVNSTQFTLAEARQASEYSLTPEERRNAQSEFLNFAGAQIGEEKNKKLTTEQAAEFSSRIAVQMKAAGYAPAAGIQLGGSILQSKQGPQDVDALMREFSVAFNVLEKGQVAIDQAAPQISELMAMDVSAEDAAKMFAVASPAAPGQESISVEAAMRAIEDLKISGKEHQFGVDTSMTVYESVKAFGHNMAERRQRLLGEGKTAEQAKIMIAKELKEAGVAADIRERRRLLAGFAQMGTELGGFAIFEAIAAGTGADFEAQRRERYKRSETGRKAKRAAELVLHNAERGAAQQPLKALQEEGETQLAMSGDLERPQDLQGAARTWSSEHLWRQGDFKQQPIRTRTAQMLREGLSGYAEGRAFLNAPAGSGSNWSNDAELAAAERNMVSSEPHMAKAARELQRLRELAEKEWDKAADKPLSAPPARLNGAPGGRMGG